MLHSISTEFDGGVIVLLEQKKLQLYLPSQIVSEFRRNREGKIADALKKLKDQRLNLRFPQICKDYPEYGKLAAGLWLVLQMNGLLPGRLRVHGWKTMMKLTLAGYWLVALLGLAIYYVWFPALSL